MQILPFSSSYFLGIPQLYWEHSWQTEIFTKDIFKFIENSRKENVKKKCQPNIESKLPSDNYLFQLFHATIARERERERVVFGDRYRGIKAIARRQIINTDKNYQLKIEWNINETIKWWNGWTKSASEREWRNKKGRKRIRREKKSR